MDSLLYEYPYVDAHTYGIARVRVNMHTYCKVLCLYNVCFLNDVFLVYFCMYGCIFCTIGIVNKYYYYYYYTNFRSAENDHPDLYWFSTEEHVQQTEKIE